MTEARGRFSASIEIASITLTFFDGHEETAQGAPAGAIQIPVPDRPNKLLPRHLIEEFWNKAGLTALTLGGDKALATAAKFGRARVEHSIRGAFEDYIVGVSEADREVVPTHFEISYVVTVLRVLDA